MTIILKKSLDINKIISKLPESAIIYASTFNISTWLTNGPARTLLAEFNLRNTNLIVGVPNYNPSVGRGESCLACYQRHSKNLRKLAQLREEFNNINWKFVKNLHAKFIVSDPYTITGGRNISDSNIGDISIVSKDKQLSNKLIAIWNEYSNTAYDIGTNGPLVFSVPYYGEIMADSTSIPLKYKQDVAENTSGEAADYWRKTLKWTNTEPMK